MKLFTHKLIYPLIGLGISGAALAAPSYNDTRQATYKEECASCHMAYPAWLLPQRSWRQVLGTLDNHFGDNAALEPATLKVVSEYLQANSADSSDVRRAKKILRSIPGDQTPTRISQLPYIKHKHDEIPARFISANPKVKSLANCIACHRGTEQGDFNDDNVNIPGFGRWDD